MDQKMNGDSLWKCGGSNDENKTSNWSVLVNNETTGAPY